MISVSLDSTQILVKDENSGSLTHTTFIIYRAKLRRLVNGVTIWRDIWNKGSQTKSGQEEETFAENDFFRVKIGKLG